MNILKESTIDGEIASMTRKINRESYFLLSPNGKRQAALISYNPQKKIDFFKKILYNLELQRSEPDWIVIGKQDQNDHDEMWKHTDPGPDLKGANRLPASSILGLLITDDNTNDYYGGSSLSRIGFMLYQLQFMWRLYQSRIIGLESDIERCSDLETCAAEVAAIKEKVQFFEKTTHYFESILDRHATDLKLCREFEGIRSCLTGGNNYSEEPKKPPRTGHLSIEVHSIKGIDHAAVSSKTSFEVSIQSDFEWTNRTACPVSHAGQAQEKEAFFDFKEIDIHATIQLFAFKRDENTGNPSTIGVLFLRVLDIVTYLGHKTHKDSTGSGNALDASPFIPINTWFLLAPAGEVHLTINFAETSRYLMQVLKAEQQSAQPIKDQKMESEHTFVMKDFDSEMRCSVCAEFLYPFSLAAQCTTCKMLCHIWCMYSNLRVLFWVPSCLKNSSTSSSSSGTKRKSHYMDQADLKYGSHQWSPLLNLSANWCSHCGYSLSLGQGNQEGANRQCEACKIICHAQCQGLVAKRCILQDHAPPPSSLITCQGDPLWAAQYDRTSETRSKNRSKPYLGETLARLERKRTNADK